MDCRIGQALYQAMLSEDDLKRNRAESTILRLLPTSMNFFPSRSAQVNL